MTGNKDRKKTTSKTSETEKAFSMSLLLMAIFYFASPSTSSNSFSFIFYCASERQRFEGHFLIANNAYSNPPYRLMDIWIAKRPKMFLWVYCLFSFLIIAGLSVIGRKKEERRSSKGQKKVQEILLGRTISNKQFYDLFMKTFRFVLKHCGLCWIGVGVPLISACFSEASCNKFSSFSPSLGLFVMSLFAKSTTFCLLRLLSLRNFMGQKFWLRMRSSPACATRSRPKNQRKFLRNFVINHLSLMSERTAFATCKIE